MRLPSIKTLTEVFGDRAKEARLLLECKLSTRDYKSVQEWEAQCHNIPPYSARLMCALNEIAETYGVEPLWEIDDVFWPSYEYLNAGDTYATTLIRNNKTGTITVGCWGDIVEKHPNRFN